MLGHYTVSKDVMNKFLSELQWEVESWLSDTDDSVFQRSDLLEATAKLAAQCGDNDMYDDIMDRLHEIPLYSQLEQERSE